MAKEAKTMGKIRRILKRVRLVYRKSSPLTKAVVLSAIILSTAALLTIRLTLGATEDRINALKDQAAALEQSQQQLEDKINNQGSLEGVKDYAEDELGLVDPDTVIVEPEE